MREDVDHRGRTPTVKRIVAWAKSLATLSRVGSGASRRMSRRLAILAGGVSAASTWAIYSVGSGRAFDYDSSVTMASFVVTPSPFDVFSRQDVFNNHPLFSFGEHLIYSLTGLQSEVAMRVLPIVAGAVAVGVLVGYLCWTVGFLPAVAGGLVLATNPMFVSETRKVRGYSMVVLMVLLGTLFLINALRTRSTIHGARLQVGYVVAAAVAIGTHLFAALAIPGHLGALAGMRRLTWAWCMRLLAACVLGVLPYALLLSSMLAAEGGRKGFAPQFPLVLTRDLLGGSPWTAIVLGVLVAVGVFQITSKRVVGLAALSMLVPLALIWILIQPADLYSRFFLWLVPGVAVLIALAVAWRPMLLLGVIGAGLFSSLTLIAPGYTADSLANRVAGALINAAAAHGETACAAGYSAETLLIYTRRFLALSSTSQLSQCSFVVILEPNQPSHHVWLEAASAMFPVRRILPASTPGVVLMRPGT
jgi:hypothetical protein